MQGAPPRRSPRSAPKKTREEESSGLVGRVGAFEASPCLARPRAVARALAYEDGGQLVFMHAESFEQITINAEMVGDRAAFLQDGMIITMSSYEGDPISVALPDTVVMEVVEADAVVKGQTASSSYKPAVLENGIRVMVPPHIETGTRIVVRPEDASYVERAKS